MKDWDEERDELLKMVCEAEEESESGLKRNQLPYAFAGQVRNIT